ncbi:substrate-binding domain-containing protein [soil metagenome]
MQPAHPRTAVGLVIARDNAIVAAEPYHHELIIGIDRVIGAHHLSVFLQVVADSIEANRTFARWASSGQVACVIVGATTFDDAGFKLLESRGMPAVVLGDPSIAPTLPHVSTDDAGTMRDALGYLAGGGHRIVGHVSGPTSVTHTGIREEAFRSECDTLSIEGYTKQGDYSSESGYKATVALLAFSPIPTALIFDNDLMALGGLRAAKDQGLDVPNELSILAWDDSVKCQLSDPPLSTLQHDIQEIGELAGLAVLDAIAERPARTWEAPQAKIHERGSTRRFSDLPICGKPKGTGPDLPVPGHRRPTETQGR